MRWARCAGGSWKEWARLEAAPPEVTRCLFRRSGATSGGAASCRAGMEMARPKAAPHLFTFHFSLVTAAAGRGGAPVARAGKRLARRARPTMERVGSGWEWARLEAAPPEVGREGCNKSCGASGGAASCRAGMGIARPKAAPQTRHSSLVTRHS